MFSYSIYGLIFLYLHVWSLEFIYVQKSDRVNSLIFQKIIPNFYLFLTITVKEDYIFCRPVKKS